MATHFAAPSGRYLDRSLQGHVWAHELQTAINRAAPGDEVVLLPGRYLMPVTIGQSGRSGAPITLRPLTPGTVVLDGGQRADAGRQGHLKPLDNDAAMIRLFFADHIVLEGLRFENCWPTAIYMRSARHITVRGCSGLGGRFFAYARQQPAQPTHHLTFEDCLWIQDPDHLMWTGQFTWKEVKGQGAYDATYFNGAFLGCFDIRGQIIIRRCDIRHAFNAIRLDMRPGGVRPGPNMAHNRDVAIYDNSFSFIRDNAIEPEKGAQNWRVFNNRFYNVHAAISLDLVAVRDLIVLGNHLLNDHRPGLLDPADPHAEPQGNQGGKVLKFLKTGTEAPQPRTGLWTLFNSVQTRTSFAKKGVSAQWGDIGTLLGMFANTHPQLTTPPRPAFKGMEWTPAMQVREMATNDPGFPAGYPAQNVSGWQVPSVFEPPRYSGTGDPLDMPLGGWDGALVPTSAAAGLSSDGAEITLADHSRISIPKGTALGAHDVDDIGLGHWREAWPQDDPQPAV